MTDKTEATETEKAKAAGARFASTLTNVAATLGIGALVSWLGILGLGDLGVSVPFTGAWLSLLVGLSVVKLAVTEASSAFHGARVKADINLIAASLAAQEAIHQQHSADGLGDLLASLSKAPGNSDNSGGHL